MTRLEREITAGAERASSLRLVAQVQRIGLMPPPAPCPYPEHRPTDWRRTDRDDAIVVCGVCHPPAVGIPTETAP